MSVLQVIRKKNESVHVVILPGFRLVKLHGVTRRLYYRAGFTRENIHYSLLFSSFSNGAGHACGFGRVNGHWE